MSIDPRLQPDAAERHEVVSVERNEVVDRPVVSPAAEEHEEALAAGPGGLRRERTVRNAVGDEHREVVVDDVAAAQWLWANKLSQVVWLLIGIVEGLIFLRIVLHILAANPAAGFTSFIYNASAPFLAPFFGIVGSPAAGGSVLEIPSIIAMVVYLLLGWLIVTIIWLLMDRPATRSMSRYDRFHM
jgi:hypothetical protein